MSRPRKHVYKAADCNLMHTLNKYVLMWKCEGQIFSIKADAYLEKQDSW